MPRSALIFAAAAAVVGIVACAVVLESVGSFATFASLAGSGASAATTAGRTWSFDLSGVRSIEVRAGSFDLAVDGAGSGGSSDTLSVAARRGLPAGITAQWSRDGDHAVLTVAAPAHFSWGAWNFTGFSNRPDFTIRGLGARSAIVSTSSGDVHASGMLGSLSVKSSSGDVTVESAAAPLDIETNSGDVRVARDDGDLTVATSSGDLRIDGVRGTFSATTSSGDVMAALLPGPSAPRAQIQTSSGDVTLTVPPGRGATLETQTSSGDVSNSAGLPSASNGAATISIQTSSGDISIR
ncbi:MAG: DUF4097 family beta strand repeat-containing protein [Vulcanimicrobiaceae bacterium]